VIQYQKEQYAAAAARSAALAAANAKAEASAFKDTYVDEDGKEYAVKVIATPQGKTRIEIPNGTINPGDDTKNTPNGSNGNKKGTPGTGFTLDMTLDDFRKNYITPGYTFSQVDGEKLPGHFTQSTGGRRRKTRHRKSRRHHRKTRRSRK